MSGTDDGLWTRVHELIDEARPADLEFHRLAGIAASRLRAQGRPVPAELVDAEARGLAAAVMAPTAIERVVELLDTPVLVLKGPVLAALYPHDHQRGYLDLDLVVADATASQRVLLANGAEYSFDEGAPADGHHERELMLPGLPISLELHHFPSWPRTGSPPQAAELLDLARAAADLPAGALALPPAEHAVIVAAHSWGHRPLRRVRDLLDVALLMAAADRDDAARAAERWHVTRIWNTTLATIESLFGDEGAPRTLPLRTWARNLPSVRKRSLAETTLEHATAQFWATNPIQAGRMGASKLGTAVRRRTLS